MFKSHRAWLLLAVLSLGGSAWSAETVTPTSPKCRLIVISCIGQPAAKEDPLNDAQIAELLLYLNQSFHGVYPAWSSKQIQRLIQGFSTVTQAAISYDDLTTAADPTTPAAPAAPAGHSVTMVFGQRAAVSAPATGGKRVATLSGNHLSLSFNIPLVNSANTTIAADKTLDQVEIGKTYLVITDDHTIRSSTDAVVSPRELLVLIRIDQ